MNDPKVFRIAQDALHPEKAREARNQLVLENMGLVHMIARTRFGSSMTHEDLVSEGVFGLIRAIELFDVEKKVAFSTYATYWIKQKINRGIQNKDLIIRFPCHIYDKDKKIQETTLSYDAILEKGEHREGNKAEWELEEDSIGGIPISQAFKLLPVINSVLSEIERDVLMKILGIGTNNSIPIATIDVSREYQKSKTWSYNIYLRAIKKIGLALNVVTPEKKPRI